MGITIHYKGRAKSLHVIDELVDTLKDIAQQSKWQYWLVDEVVKGKFSPSVLLFDKCGLVSECSRWYIKIKARDVLHGRHNESRSNAKRSAKRGLIILSLP